MIVRYLVQFHGFSGTWYDCHDINGNWAIFTELSQAEAFRARHTDEPMRIVTLTREGNVST